MPALLDLDLRWPSARAKEWACRVLPALCESPLIRAVVVYGSSARPVGASHDLDLLIVYDRQAPELDPPPMDADVRSYSSAETRSLIRQGHDLLGWALRMGVVICERDEYWTRLRRELLPGLALPSPDAADQRAARSRRLLQELLEIGDLDAAVEQLVTLLTHRARGALLRAGVFPASRPELPDQLRRIGHSRLAEALSVSIAGRDALARGADVDWELVRRYGDAA